MIKIKGVPTSQLIIKSGINKNTLHPILRGSRKPSRNKVIQLAFGLLLTIDETNELLIRAEI
jgi:hypothetical protein